MSDDNPGDLILLMFTPREDANERGLDSFLRDTDNPFFNAVPGIREYTNWKTVSAPDSAVPFCYFDLLFLDSSDHFDAVWGNPELQAFAGAWVKEWGRYPDVPPEQMDRNFCAYRCAHVAGPRDIFSKYITFAPSRSPQGLSKKSSVYRINSTIVGDIRYTHFAITPVKRPDDFDKPATSLGSPFYGSICAEVIAAPPLFHRKPKTSLFGCGLSRGKR